MRLRPLKLRSGHLDILPGALSSNHEFGTGTKHTSPNPGAVIYMLELL
jgi:hypothetical protein